jgi:hypothetical protein
MKLISGLVTSQQFSNAVEYNTYGIITTRNRIYFPQNKSLKYAIT